MLDVLDIHTHTTASGHAYNTIYEMAQSASRKGLALLGISDHGPAMEGSASKHYFRSSRCIPRELYGVKILFGCELNIMDYDGGVDLDEVFAGALDYGIASLHDVCITPGSRAENTRAYLKAMENPKVHIIGHPDDGTYAVDFDELVRHARERGVMIELNEASVRPGSYRKKRPRKRGGCAGPLRALRREGRCQQRRTCGMRYSAPPVCAGTVGDGAFPGRAGCQSLGGCADGRAGGKESIKYFNACQTTGVLLLPF